MKSGRTSTFGELRGADAVDRNAVSGELHGQGCPTDKDSARLCVSHGHRRPPPEPPGPSVRLLARPGCSRSPPGRGGGTPAPRGPLTPCRGGRFSLCPASSHVAPAPSNLIGFTVRERESPSFGDGIKCHFLTYSVETHGARGPRDDAAPTSQVCLCQTDPEPGTARCGNAATGPLSCPNVTSRAARKHVSPGPLILRSPLPCALCIILNINSRIRTKRISTRPESLQTKH